MMLHTLAHTYHQIDSASLLQLINQQDAILLWQDGVTIAVKQTPLLQELLAKKINIYALKQDIEARGLMPILDPLIIIIEMEKCIELTEKYYPQLAW